MYVVDCRNPTIDLGTCTEYRQIGDTFTPKGQTKKCYVQHILWRPSLESSVVTYSPRCGFSFLLRRYSRKKQLFIIYVIGIARIQIIFQNSSNSNNIINQETAVNEVANFSERSSVADSIKYECFYLVNTQNQNEIRHLHSLQNCPVCCWRLWSYRKT